MLPAGDNILNNLQLGKKRFIFDGSPCGVQHQREVLKQVYSKANS